MDLKPQVLDVLVCLMLAQARECLFEKLQLQIESLSLRDSRHVIILVIKFLFFFPKDIFKYPQNCCYIFILFQLYKDLAGEASQLTLEYNDMHKNIQLNDTHTYLPECWAGLVPLKAEYYKGL